MNTKYYRFVLFVTLWVAQVLTACGSPATSVALPSEPTLLPTSAPAPTVAPEPADPAAVVQSFWDSLKAEDIDAAMALLSEDVKCRGACYITGKESVRFYVQGIIDAGLVTEINNLTIEGDTVTYLYKVFRNGFLVEENAEGESMQVVDGKIILWNNLHYF